MLAAHPRGAQQRLECFDCLPLTFCAWHAAPVAVVRAVLAAHPPAAADVDGERRLALHWAAAQRAEEAVVALLVQSHPAG